MAAARFITETSLDLLARRLRMLGYDVECISHATLAELFRAARASGRVVITASRRHPRAFAGVPALAVAREDAAAAVRVVAERHEASDAPFTRCSHCNVTLVMHPSREAAGQAPEEIVQRFERLAQCPRCRRWYWHGSHVDRMRAWLERALGRPVELPGPPDRP